MNRYKFKSDGYITLKDLIHIIELLNLSIDQNVYDSITDESSGSIDTSIKRLFIKEE